MTGSPALAALETMIASERSRLGTLELERRPLLDRLFLEDIALSMALTGAELSLRAVETLVCRGRVVEPQPLESCIAVADYADAVRFLRDAPMPSPRRPFLRLEEVVGLHARAMRRSAAGEPGTWRRVNVGPLVGGMIPPGPALVPPQMLAFVERLASGPRAGESALLWLTRAHHRFARIHPFRHGSGRTARLVVNLLLRRLGLPPCSTHLRSARRYTAALPRAGPAELEPLALFIGRAILRSLHRLGSGSDAELVPLASLATGAERAALYKAAQRGRLRALRRDGALLTTPNWIAEYRTSRRQDSLKDMP